MPADFEVNELAALRVTRRAQNTMCPKENWPKHKASAKFEQGGFTSRRRGRASSPVFVTRRGMSQNLLIYSSFWLRLIHRLSRFFTASRVFVSPQ
jgi:hypothetical protein